MSVLLKIVICVILAVLAVIPFISKGEIWPKIASTGIGIIGALVTIFSTSQTTVNAQHVTIYQNSEIKVYAPLDNELTQISLQNRNLSSKLQNESWFGDVVANEGDIIRFKVTYTNKSDNVQNNVLMFVKWSEYLDYIQGSTILYNSNHKEGINLESDGLADDTGINIGNYLAGASGVVTYEARVKTGLGIGANVLRNWTQIYVNDLTPELGTSFVQDYADVTVLKEE